jgi:hypothetical protein
MEDGMKEILKKLHREVSEHPMRGSDAMKNLDYQNCVDKLINVAFRVIPIISDEKAALLLSDYKIAREILFQSDDSTPVKIRGNAIQFIEYYINQIHRYIENKTGKNQGYGFRLSDETIYYYDRYTQFKVYVVLDDGAYGYSLEAVFSTKSKAEKAIKEWNKYHDLDRDYIIEEKVLY